MNEEKEIIKEYTINESVLVTYHTLNSLYQHFVAMYPTKIGNKIIDLINDLIFPYSLIFTHHSSF